MQKISRIMCVVDLDADAQSALQRSAWLAKKLGAELELLICYYNEYLSDGRLGNYPSLEKCARRHSRWSKAAPRGHGRAPP